MAYGDIKEIKGVKYKDITPNMTGMNTPTPYKVTASSSGVLWEDEPWMIFNGTGNAHVVWTRADSIVTLDFSQVVNVDYVELWTGNDVATRGVTMAGGNDNVSYINICSVKSYNCEDIIHPDQMIVLPERVSYRYFRFTSFPSSDWCHHDQFRLYQKVEREYFIVKDNEVYKTISNDVISDLTETSVTKMLFETRGFADINWILAVQTELSTTFEILRYDPTAANTAIEISHLPSPQTIMPKQDIALGEIATITNVQLTTTGTTGAIKILLSTNSGASWKTCHNGLWADAAINTIQSVGMTPTDLVAITAAKWAELQTTKIRFAYCLTKDAITNDLVIDTLTITGNVYGDWEKAEHDAEYNYEYTDSKTLVVKLFKDGSYKINYADMT